MRYLGLYRMSIVINNIWAAASSADSPGSVKVRVAVTALRVPRPTRNALGASRTRRRRQTPYGALPPLPRAWRPLGGSPSRPLGGWLDGLVGGFGLPPRPLPAPGRVFRPVGRSAAATLEALGRRPATLHICQNGWEPTCVKQAPCTAVFKTKKVRFDQ